MEINMKIPLTIFLLASLACVACEEPNRKQTAVTRTELKVARSLDPDKMQTLNVVTKTGSIATLIVKRRDSKSHRNSTETQKDATTAAPIKENIVSESKEASTLKSTPTTTTVSPTSSSSVNTNENYQSNFIVPQKENKFNGIIRPEYGNWSPIAIVTLDSASSPSETSRITYTQKFSEKAPPAKVYISSTYMDKSHILRSLPAPVDIRSDDIFVKNQENKKGRAFSSDIQEEGGNPTTVIHGVRVPDDSDDDKKIWRNARVINGELVPYEKGYKPPPVIPFGELVFASDTTTDAKNTKSFGPFTKFDNYAMQSKQEKSNIGPFTVKDNLSPDYEGTPERSSVFDSDRYIRFNKDTSFGPFTKADNSRVANSKLIDYIKEINAKEVKRDYFSGRVRKNLDYSTDQNSNVRFPETQQIQRRMLQYVGNVDYPTSKLYSVPSTTKLSPVNFVDGVRTPVLQYAHPELGVQPVKVPLEDETTRSASDRSQMYYTKDKKNDHTHYLQGETPASEKRVYLKNNRQTQYYDNSGIMYPESPGYYRKDVINYPYNNGYYTIKHTYQQPFWYKITETIKDNIQTGMEKMQQFTKPVFEPIVEATQKISQNLGFSHPNQHVAQDKMGGPVMASSTSVILPALGLVAGGAALGLGAAAVGRFLDVGLMRRSQENNNEYLDQLEMQHKRALDAYEQYKQPQEVLVFMEEDNNNNDNSFSNLQKTEQIHSRARRAVDGDNSEVFILQELGQDLNDGDGRQSVDLQYLSQAAHWTDTPCAKRLFCDAMLRQKSDQIALMEKKMDYFISLVHPVVAQSVSYHLHDVMNAIKQHDCSQFVCTRRLV